MKLRKFLNMMQVLFESEIEENLKLVVYEHLHYVILDNNRNINKSYLVVDCWLVTVRRGETKLLNSAFITENVGSFSLFIKYCLIVGTIVELINLTDSTLKQTFCPTQICRKPKIGNYDPHSLNPDYSRIVTKWDLFLDKYTYNNIIDRLDDVIKQDKNYSYICLALISNCHNLSMHLLYVKIPTSVCISLFLLHLAIVI